MYLQMIMEESRTPIVCSDDKQRIYAEITNTEITLMRFEPTYLGLPSTRSTNTPRKQSTKTCFEHYHFPVHTIVYTIWGDMRTYIPATSDLQVPQLCMSYGLLIYKYTYKCIYFVLPIVGLAELGIVVP